MKEKIAEYIYSWFRETSPSRKLLDAVVAFVIALLAGSLYLAYESEADLRRIAVKSLSRMPTLNRDKIKEDLPAMYSALEEFDVQLAAVFEVDLSANIATLVEHKGKGKAKENFDKMVGSRRKRPFVSGDLHEIGLMAMGSLMRGDKVVCPDPIDPTMTTLFVPIPDRAGSFLAGYIVIVWDKPVDDNTLESNQAKLIIGEYTGGFSD